MKKILGLALGLTMIALTPAVGNAAGMIEITCGKLTFLVDSAGGKQTLAKYNEFKNVEVSFLGDEKIYSRHPRYGTAVFDIKTGQLSKGGEVFPEKCTFKNLAALKQANKNMKISKLGGDIAALMVCGDRRAEKELGQDWEIIKRELRPIFKKYSGKNAVFDKSYN